MVQVDHEVCVYDYRVELRYSHTYQGRAFGITEGYRQSKARSLEHAIEQGKQFERAMERSDLPNLKFSWKVLWFGPIWIIEDDIDEPMTIIDLTDDVIDLVED